MLTLSMSRSVPIVWMKTEIKSAGTIDTVPELLSVSGYLKNTQYVTMSSNTAGSTTASQRPIWFSAVPITFSTITTEIAPIVIT